MPKPQVVFTPEAWDWIHGYTKAVDTEIGGFGYVTNPEKGVFVVDAVFLAPQEVSSGSVHFDDGAMGFMVEKAIEDDRLNDARFSWHSHNTMGCFWSSTDEEGVQDYKNTGMPWLVSAVTNQKGEIKCRVDIFDSCLDHITIQETDVRIGVPPANFTEEILKDIQNLVTKRPTQAKNSNYGTGTGSSHKGKHRPAGQKQLPAGSQTGSGHRTSADWWDEIDWANVDDEELSRIMKEHGFDVDAEEITSEDEDAARQMAKLEAMH